MLFEGDERQDGKLLLLTLYGSHLILCLIRLRGVCLSTEILGRKTHRVEASGRSATHSRGRLRHTILVSADGMNDGGKQLPFYLLLCFGGFCRFLCGIFMNPLTEAALHSLGQENGRLAILVAHPVQGRKRTRPLLVQTVIQKVHLLRQVLKI